MDQSADKSNSKDKAISREEYRKLQNFAYDPEPLPWSMRHSSICGRELLTSLEDQLAKYLMETIRQYIELKENENDNAAKINFKAAAVPPTVREHILKLIADVFGCMRMIRIKFALLPKWNGPNDEYDRDVLISLIANQSGEDKELLYNLLFHDKKQAGQKPLFGSGEYDELLASIHSGGIVRWQTLDERYNACAIFIESKEEIPEYLRGLLQYGQILGNPFEQIINEKARSDIYELNFRFYCSKTDNTQAKEAKMDQYLERCKVICMEVYRMKITLNRKMYPKLDSDSDRDSRFNSWETVRQDPGELGALIKAVSDIVDQESLDTSELDWDLLYRYVFCELLSDFIPEIANKGGLYSQKAGGLKKKAAFLMSVYKSYYEYYVKLERKLEILNEVMNRRRFDQNMAEEISRLQKEREQLLDARPFGKSAQQNSSSTADSKNDPYVTYHAIVDKCLNHNEAYDKGFVYAWSKFHNGSFGIFPKRKNLKECSYFEVYPPATADNLYAFCLMLGIFKWDDIVNLADFIFDFYFRLKTDGAYADAFFQLGRLAASEVSKKNYLRRVNSLDLESLRCLGQNPADKRTQCIKDYFFGYYLSNDLDSLRCGKRGAASTEISRKLIEKFNAYLASNGFKELTVELNP